MSARRVSFHLPMGAIRTFIGVSELGTLGVVGESRKGKGGYLRHKRSPDPCMITVFLAWFGSSSRIQVK